MPELIHPIIANLRTANSLPEITNVEGLKSLLDVKTKHTLSGVPDGLRSDYCSPYLRGGKAFLGAIGLLGLSTSYSGIGYTSIVTQEFEQMERDLKQSGVTIQLPECTDKTLLGMQNPNFINGRPLTSLVEMRLSAILDFCSAAYQASQIPQAMFYEGKRESVEYDALAMIERVKLAGTWLWGSLDQAKAIAQNWPTSANDWRVWKAHYDRLRAEFMNQGIINPASN